VAKNKYIHKYTTLLYCPSSPIPRPHLTSHLRKQRPSASKVQYPLATLSRIFVPQQTSRSQYSTPSTPSKNQKRRVFKIQRVPRQPPNQEFCIKKSTSRISNNIHIRPPAPSPQPLRFHQSQQRLSPVFNFVRVLQEQK